MGHFIRRLLGICELQEKTRSSLLDIKDRIERFIDNHAYCEDCGAMVLKSLARTEDRIVEYNSPTMFPPTMFPDWGIEKKKEIVTEYWCRRCKKPKKE